jgi:hypothetical protein
MNDFIAWAMILLSLVVATFIACVIAAFIILWRTMKDD